MIKEGSGKLRANQILPLVVYKPGFSIASSSGFVSVFLLHCNLNTNTCV